MTGECRVPFDSSIIVIGPDRVGKTSTVQRLTEITGLPTFKAPSEKKIFREGGSSSLVFDYTLTHFLEQTGHRFISDRGYPCEWAYSRVFGRVTDDELLEHIDARHEAIRTQILYIYSSVPPTEEDDLVPAEKYWDVKSMYDKFSQWTSCRVTAVDARDLLQTYRNGGDSSIEFALRCLEEMRR